ncbi:ABC transporter permease [Clostridium manihotivorum]|uniref:ABC transporter permease n=1 Tax=Clostridium manihotivorum TaxID=2320868 RepID=A0A410DQR1_9CLOT|nr:ABC transporter permease [Clostridium manihotivorum]QAA31371.1 ABC transporter permease [Clostridium manihotivorum]
MRPYISFLKIRFINGLQYRSAAYAGIVTQFAWGFMYIMLYQAFYKSGSSKVPMDFKELSSYIWLQQGFLALFMTWFLENDIFDLISSGNVAYELIRPLDLYNIWFTRNCATRLAKAVLRCFPILIIALFLPEPYRFHGPYSMESAIFFFISMTLAFILVVAYCMLIYIFTMYTISPMGIRMVLVMLADFLAGGLVPLPLLPDYFTKYINLLPFAFMQNTPFRIYSGNLPATDCLKSILLQLVWLGLLVILGKVIISRALKHVVVQGG